jgi:hypothetical protein
MATIYAKTAAGQNEIETRARRLPPRARSLLILVDGKRSDADLAQLVPSSDETLAQLLDAGLVQAVAGSPAAAPPASVAAAAPAAPAAPAVDMLALRREAARAITDLLGPAGDSITLKLEKASDPAEVRAQLEKAVTYIANVRGGGAAAQFASRFLKSEP